MHHSAPESTVWGGGPQTPRFGKPCTPRMRDLLSSARMGSTNVQIQLGEAQGLDLNKLRDTIKASVRQSVIDELAPAVDKCLGPVKRTMEEIVRTTVKTELPLAVYKSFEPVGQLVTETVKTSVENTWASLFYGDDFPKADSKEAKDAPKKPKVTFNTAMKRAITDQHRDESRKKMSSYIK